jgi:hypothetical protein
MESSILLTKVTVHTKVMWQGNFSEELKEDNCG